MVLSFLNFLNPEVGRQRHHSCLWPGLYILGQPVPVSLRGLRYEYHYISGVGGLVGLVSCGLGQSEFLTSVEISAFVPCVFSVEV